jgi:hypothetical protein
MDSHTTKPEKLWPIVMDDRIPLPPAAWTCLNITIGLLITVPFLLVAGSAAACLWLIDVTSALLAAHLGNGMVLLVIVDILKAVIAYFAVRMELAMAFSGGIRYLVHEARDALREFDPPPWL